MHHHRHRRTTSSSRVRATARRRRCLSSSLSLSLCPVFLFVSFESPPRSNRIPVLSPNKNNIPVFIAKQKQHMHEKSVFDKGILQFSSFFLSFCLFLFSRSKKHHHRRSQSTSVGRARFRSNSETESPGRQRFFSAIGSIAGRSWQTYISFLLFLRVIRIRIRSDRSWNSHVVACKSCVLSHTTTANFKSYAPPPLPPPPFPLTLT
jgi:hypothetical protein